MEKNINGGVMHCFTYFFLKGESVTKVLAVMMYSIIPEGGVLTAMQPVVECQFCLKVPSRTGEGQKEE